MTTTHRTLDLCKLTVLALALTLALSHPAAARQTSAPTLYHTVQLRMVESAADPDGQATRVTFHGDHPISYSVTGVSGDAWGMTLDGVDARQVAPETQVGSPQVGRIVVAAGFAEGGRHVAKVRFEGGSPRDRRVRLEGNDLIVEMKGEAPPPPPAEEKVEVAIDPPAPPAPTTVDLKSAPAHSAPITVDLNPVAAAPTPKVSFVRTLSAAEESGGGDRSLTVAAGKSITLDLDAPTTRVSVANPGIADAVVISPQQILINGLMPGSTSLVLWFRSGPPRNYDLTVQMDTETLAARIRQYFPGQNIAVGVSKETVVLSGTVTNPEIGEKAVKLASDYSGKVLNNLTYPADGRRQVSLKIVFAEVNEQALTELSASLFRIDPNNPRGDHEGLSGTGRPGALGNFINDPRGPEFNFGDAINLYAFNFRDKFGAFITAMKTRGLLQVLAEPNLITADGQKAAFLAGGEFPIPIAQAGAGFTSVTVEFKKFGISLDFLPIIRDTDTIVLKVTPEVSSLDFANAVILSGFRIPALKVRRAETEVELKDGQSFAIAGLYSADLAQTKKKIPLLGDIPLLGYLFKSKNLEKNKTQLLVIATPTIVQPLPAGQTPVLPTFPESFDLEKKKKGEEAGDSGTAAGASAPAAK